MGTALLKFSQGITIGTPGQALMVVDGTPVVAGNNDDSHIVKWTFTWLDTPPGSAIPRGLAQTGATPTLTFTPDVPDSYLLQLDTLDDTGHTATDIRAVAVLRPTGRFIPPFEGSSTSINFGGQTRGWAPDMETWLNYLDSLTFSSGAKSTFVFRPAGVATGNVYTSWSLLVTALLACPGPKWVEVDGSLAAAHVPTGTWNLNGFVTFVTSQAVGSAAAKLTFDDGAVFTYTQLTLSGPVVFACDSTSPVATQGAGSLLLLRDGAQILSNPGKAVWLRVSASTPQVVLLNGSTLGGGATAAVTVAAATIMSLTVFSNSVVSASAISGAGTVNAVQDDSGLVNAQTVATLNLTLAALSQQVAYTPAVPADWITPNPTQVKQALDDLAALVPHTRNWAVTTVWWDPANSTALASDDMTNPLRGLDAAHPLLTWNAGVVGAFWGTYSPNFPATVTVNQMSSQPGTTDPVQLSPYGAVVVIVGALGAAQTIGTGTLGSVISKNSSTRQLLTATLTPGTGAVAIGQLIFNSSKGSYAHINFNVSGNVWNISQPYTTGLAEDDTWANGDSYTLFTPVSTAIGGTYALNSFITFEFVSQITVNAEIIKTNFFFCNILGLLINGDTSSIVACDISSSVWRAIGVATTNIIGGQYRGNAIGIAGQFAISGDFIFRGLQLLQAAGSIQNCWTMSTGVSQNFWNIVGGVQVTGYLTGDWKINVSVSSFGSGGALQLSSGTFTSRFLNSGGLLIDGVAFADAFDRTVTPGQWYPKRALTAAALDAAIGGPGGTGFNGIAYGADGAVAIFSLSAITDVSATTPFVLDVAHGGTGLAAPGANGNVLTSNGSVWISAPLPADVDFYQTFEANGVAGVPQRAAVNFVAGTGISVAISDVAGVTTLTIVNTSPASADTDFYQQVEANAGGSVVQRPILNFINGSNISVTAVDNPGNNRTDVTVTSTAPEGPDFYQTVVDESNNPVTQRPTIKFGGNGATISTFDDGANNRTVVFLTAYSQVQANGAGEPKRTVLNFLPGFIVADNPGNGSTDVGPAAGSAFGRIFSSGGTIQAISTAGTTYQLALWDTNRPSHVDTADEANGRIIIGHTGTYKIELSIQCSIDIIDQLAFTIRRNGTPFEGGVITIIGSAQGTSNELFMQVHIDGGFVACAGGDFITAAVTPIFNNGAQISYRGSLSTQQIA